MLGEEGPKMSLPDRERRDLVAQANEFRVVSSPGGVKFARRAVAREGAEIDVVKRRRAIRLARGGGWNTGRRRGRDDAERRIREFSERSRSNMRWTFAALPWAECGPGLAMITLTYPMVFPENGREVVRHREAWKERWRKKWGAPKGAWAFEFQERGAPHLHTYLGRPQVDEEVFEGWVRRAWYEVVGSDDPLHLRWGVDVTSCFYGSAELNGARVAEYFWRESGKRRQKEVPEWFRNVPRYWGYWGIRPVLRDEEWTVDEWVEARRPFLALRDKKGVKKFAHPRGLDGAFVLSGDGFALADRLHEWAAGVVVDKAVGL